MGAGAAGATLRAPSADGARRGGGHRDGAMAAVQALTAVAVLGYAASLVLVHRPPDHYLTFWDGWVSEFAGTLPCLPILLHVVRHPGRRWAWSLLGLGIAANTAGNLLFQFRDQWIVPYPDPAWSDWAYLGSNVLLTVGLVAMTQRARGERDASVRLDGVIAGLALGGLAVLLWFGPLFEVGGGRLAHAVNLAYPVTDLILLVALVAGLAPQRYRPTLVVGLVMAGILWCVVGDVIFLRQVAATTYNEDTPLDATWLLGYWCLGLAAWPAGEPRRAVGRTVDRHDPAAAPGLGLDLVPVVFGAVALAVLAVALVRPRHAAVAAGMALAGLGVVIVRMLLTIREVRRSAADFRDARTDVLTGLPNRRGLLEATEALVTAPGGGTVGVALLDLDGFKEVNDTFGHRSGDRLLAQAATRFQRAVGGRGTVARLGGDEFALAAAVPSADDFLDLVERLTGSLLQPVAVEGVPVRLAGSAGVAFAPDHAVDPTDLLHCADLAMYRAKAAGGGTCVFEPGEVPVDRDHGRGGPVRRRDRRLRPVPGRDRRPA